MEGGAAAARELGLRQLAQRLDDAGDVSEL